MDKFRRIAVLGPISFLLPGTRLQIAALSEHPVTFPDRDAVDEGELVARTGDADAVLLAWGTTISASYLARCPQVRYIGVCATSLADIDSAAAAERGITLTNITDYGDEATAEFVFARLLALARGDGPYRWREEPAELHGKTLGVVGLGAVGAEVAGLALAFGMNVLYSSRTRKPAWEGRGCHYVELPELLSSSHIVSLHTPRGVRILGAGEFALLRAGTILVDTAVGDVLDLPAFKAWIADPRNYAIFDYATGEEYYREFADLPRVVFPPAVAGMTYESRQRLGAKILSHLRDYLAAH